MSFASQYNEIQGRLNTQWGVKTPISWPNVSFTPPNPQASWIRLVIKDTEAVQIDIGADKSTFRNAGVIYVSVFGKPNTGTDALAKLADDAAAVFRNWCGINVRCRAASVQDLGIDQSGWYMFQVKIPYQRDELI